MSLEERSPVYFVIYKRKLFPGMHRKKRKDVKGMKESGMTPFHLGVRGRGGQISVG